MEDGQWLWATAKEASQTVGVVVVDTSRVCQSIAGACMILESVYRHLIIS